MLVITNYHSFQTQVSHHYKFDNFHRGAEVSSNNCTILEADLIEKVFFSPFHRTPLSPRCRKTAIKVDSSRDSNFLSVLTGLKSSIKNSVESSKLVKE